MPGIVLVNSKVNHCLLDLRTHRTKQRQESHRRLQWHASSPKQRGGSPATLLAKWASHDWLWLVPPSCLCSLFKIKNSYLFLRSKVKCFFPNALHCNGIVKVSFLPFRYIVQHFTKIFHYNILQIYKDIIDK
jgi:hypothetical protein